MQIQADSKPGYFASPKPDMPAPTPAPAMSDTQTLLFTKDEWDAAMPMLTAAMTKFLQPYRTPVFIDRGHHGDGWGSGSFVEVDGRKYLLTNQHVATVRHKGDQLGVRYHGQDGLFILRGDHVEKDWPWDLALIPISDDAWSCVDHAAQAISVDQIALVQTAYPTEVFAFSGYAGQNTSFHFETMFFGATTSLSREVGLPADDRWDTRFHFGLDYRPDLAETVIGDHGLPTPPGLSGSTVWNTCFVEAKVSGLPWTPDLARVAGVVWGWPSSHGLLVATRAEHVRSFMLGGPGALA